MVDVNADFSQYIESCTLGFLQQLGAVSVSSISIAEALNSPSTQ